MRVSRQGFGVLLLVALRTAFCAYRAVHQSLTTDEAMAFQQYIEGPWSRAFGPYEANNHVLFTLLAKLSTHAFGLSEFTLRLPSLLAGVAYVVGVAALLAKVRSPWVRWMGLLGLALHPLILDFSIAARGYGLALALLVWGIDAAREGASVWAGVLLGLAVAANFTMAFPVLAILICHLDSIPSRVRASIAAILTAAAICAPAFRGASMGSFYAGLPTLRSSMEEITWASIRSIVEGKGLFGVPEAAQWMANVMLPALAMLLAVEAWRDRRLDFAARMLMAVLLTLGGLFAAHHLFGVLYPVNRTGLYLPALFGLAWILGADLEKIRLVRWAYGAAGMLLILQFATQLQTRAFYVWPYDRTVKSLVEMVKERSSGLPVESVSVSVSGYQLPTVEFYRRFLNVSAMKPVARTWTQPVAGCDYYFLHAVQRPVDEKIYTVVAGDPLTGMYLAVDAKPK
jgi:hypothetical protein